MARNLGITRIAFRSEWLAEDLEPFALERHGKQHTAEAERLRRRDVRVIRTLIEQLREEPVVARAIDRTAEALEDFGISRGNVVLITAPWRAAHLIAAAVPTQRRIEADRSDVTVEHVDLEARAVLLQLARKLDLRRPNPDGADPAAPIATATVPVRTFDELLAWATERATPAAS